MKPSREDQRVLLGLARASIARRLGLDLPDPVPDDRSLPSLVERRGVFVTLKLPGGPAPDGLRLRGCIGTLQADRALHESVAHYAEKAAFEDPRFPALTEREFPDLHIGVSVLSPLRPITDPGDIVIGRHGVQLDLASRRSVFLPQVAVEQGWDTDRLLRELAGKAGLEHDGWRGAELSVFETFSFGDDR